MKIQITVLALAATLCVAVGSWAAPLEHKGWELYCETDIFTDERRCSMAKAGSGPLETAEPYRKTGDSARIGNYGERVFAIKLRKDGLYWFTHNDGSSGPALRVDKHEPHYFEGRRGPWIVPTPFFLKRLREGKTLRVRYSQRGVPWTFAVDLDGINEAIRTLEVMAKRK